MTFIGVFALDDPLRDKVRRSIQFAQVGRINVRLVSGDNLDTAISYAIQAGIITEEESKINNVCMSGEDFRRAAGEIRKDNEGKWSLERPDDFRRVMK